MSKKTHPHKRSHARKRAKRQTINKLIAGYRPRAGIAGLVIASLLLVTAALAYWEAEDEAVAPASVRTEAANKSPVKNVSTLSERELADIPPEAFHPQPRAEAGYNAHSDGLPPGALPPGVVLPGLMQGERTTAQGYGMNDGIRQQFTSKERDNETGLDYFGARYYSSAQGRFTSPDEFRGGPQEVYTLGKGDPEKQALPYADITNPQSLNKYTYALNNPLRFVDPNGQEPQDGLEIQLRHDEKALAEGRMTEQEFLARARARGAGAIVGLAALAAIRVGPQIAMALLGWAARNPGAANQIAQDIVGASTGSPAPSSASLSGEALGLAREARVAEIVGGEVVRRPITVANVGKTEIDVIGKAGEYIAVGGPAKAGNLSRLGKQLSMLRRKAEEDGVRAFAYFAKGTPESVLKVARRRLGAENVHIFDLK